MQFQTEERPEPHAVKINPLAMPKGVNHVCELTGKPATLMCPYSKVVFYSTRDVQLLDWRSIHRKIWPLLAELRAPQTALGTEEERRRKEQHLQNTQRLVLEITRNEAMKYLHQCQYELAIPAALQCLRASMGLYGAGSVEIVPAYLLLGEACIGEGRYKQAEEYLSLAKWSVLKSPNCSNMLKSQLHRNFGKLYASQGKPDDALRQLAMDIYHVSLACGPEHISTSGGYYQMANVFYSQDKIEKALANYAKVIDIWYRYLWSILQDPDFAETNGLDDVQATEALQMLYTICKTRKSVLSESHPAIGESHYVLGLLFKYLADHERAKENLQSALTILSKELGQDHASTVEVMSALESYDEQ